MMLLELSPKERDEMVRIVESTLANTREEVRRTRNPEWREWLHEEENILQSVLERLKLLETEAPLAH